ncbi:MAG: DUF3667 domain-containing protein [Muribaculaceae bacterium]|nr:DUF3667 domain-containing protein [Muribaculaceae bacterium]
MVEFYKEKYQKYKDWKRQPFEVAEMSQEEHECATCGTEFVGNFCPRCGQSSKVAPRMSAWKTFLLVLDVWGIGNRGMFRTLRDLILRPGYLICDYLQGRRSAYFPPFKLLFLLTTVSILVGHGFNINHENYLEVPDQFTLEDEEFTRGKQAPIFLGLVQGVNAIKDFQQDYPAIFQLIYMSVAGYFFYIFFKNSKILGRLSFSEFLIGLVYMLNMYILYNTVVRFFGYFGIDELYWMSLSLLYLIPLKQMSGYSVWSTIWRALAGLIIGIFAIIIIGLLVLCALVVIYHE